MAHWLIVEDDELLRDGLQAQLAQAGHQVSAAADGAQALAALAGGSVDGLILDLGLPPVNGAPLDGLMVLRQLRQRLPALPVLILTARDGVDDRVAGLHAGADDYLTKPFSMAELQARVLALLRRAQLPAFTGSGDWLMDAPRPLRVHGQWPQAWLGYELLELSQREWTLLRLLVAQAGQVVGREEVLAAWQADPTEPVTPSANSAQAGTTPGGVSTSNVLEVYVHRLRRKLADSGLSIRNVRGLGYLLEREAP